MGNQVFSVVSYDCLIYLKVTEFSRQVLLKSSRTVAGSQVVVHRCRESHLYFPAPLASLTIQKSSFSTVFTGPVSPLPA